MLPLRFLVRNLVRKQMSDLSARQKRKPSILLATTKSNSFPQAEIARKQENPSIALATTRSKPFPHEEVDKILKILTAVCWGIFLVFFFLNMKERKEIRKLLDARKMM